MRRATRMLAAISAGLIAIHRDRGDRDEHVGLQQMPDLAGGGSDHHLTGAHGIHNSDLHRSLARVRWRPSASTTSTPRSQAGYQLGWVNGSGTGSSPDASPIHGGGDGLPLLQRGV